MFIPLIVYRESLSYEHLMKRLGDIASLESVALISTTFVAILLILVAILLLWKLGNSRYIMKNVALFLFVYLITYATLSYVVTGVFAGQMSLNHHLYIVNIVLIFAMFKRGKLIGSESVSEEVNFKKWTIFFIIIIVFISILSLIAANFHEGLPGGHNRF